MLWDNFKVPCQISGVSDWTTQLLPKPQMLVLADGSMFNQTPIVERLEAVKAKYQQCKTSVVQVYVGRS